MNNMSSRTELQASDRTVSPDVMIKRLLRVARILAAVQCRHGFDDETAENCAENPLRCELRYREQEPKSHTVWERQIDGYKQAEETGAVPTPTGMGHLLEDKQ